MFLSLVLLLSVSFLSLPVTVKAAEIDNFLSYVPAYDFLMIAEMSDGKSYAFQLPIPFDRDFPIAVSASDGEHYISCTTNIEEIEGVPYVCYIFDFSYLLGSNVALMSVDLSTTTSRIVPDDLNIICMWEGYSSWQGRAATSFVYNAVSDSVSLYESEWLLDTEVRTYSDATGRGRVSLSPVRPAIVTSSLVSIAFDEPRQFFVFYVPVLDPRNSESGVDDSISAWDAYISKQNVVESTGLPNGLDWFADMAKGILQIQLLPGITIGGLTFAFIAIPLVVAFLKLFAGG